MMFSVGENAALIVFHRLSESFCAPSWIVFERERDSLVNLHLLGIDLCDQIALDGKEVDDGFLRLSSQCRCKQSRKVGRGRKKGRGRAQTVVG